MSGVSAVRLHGMTEASVRGAGGSFSCSLRNQPLDTSQPGPKIFSLKLKKNWSQRRNTSRNGLVVGINLEEGAQLKGDWREKFLIGNSPTREATGVERCPRSSSLMSIQDGGCWVARGWRG